MGSGFEWRDTKRFKRRYGIRVKRYEKIERQIRDESKRVTKRFKSRHGIRVTRCEKAQALLISHLVYSYLLLSYSSLLNHLTVLGLWNHGDLASVCSNRLYCLFNT